MAEGPGEASSQALGRRVLVWGGGGKTTLAGKLGLKLGLPVVELDAIFWLPDWVERDRDEFRQLVRDTIAGHDDGWVVDGQYVGVLGGDVLERADTLIWLELPFRTIFWRTFKRTVQRARDRRTICGDNTESWRQSFLSRDSLLLYLLKNRLTRHRQSLAVREGVIREFGSGATVIRLTSAKDLDRFYDDHGLTRP